MEQNRSLGLLSLARKGGNIVLGEEQAGAAARASRARLMLLASDAGGHTVRRAKSFVAGTAQPLLTLPIRATSWATPSARRAAPLPPSRMCSLRWRLSRRSASRKSMRTCCRSWTSASSAWKSGAPRKRPTAGTSGMGNRKCVNQEVARI